MGLVYRGEYANPHMVELELEFLEARLAAIESSAATAATVIRVTIGRVLTSDDDGSTVTNQGAGGAVTVVLPSAVSPMTMRFYVQTAQTLTVTANAGDTIRIGDNVTAQAGSIASDVVGSLVYLVAVNDAEWISFETAGSWTF